MFNKINGGQFTIKMLQFMVVSAIFILETDAICPPGLDVRWEELGHNCYHVSKETVQKKF